MKKILASILTISLLLVIGVAMVHAQEGSGVNQGEGGGANLPPSSSVPDKTTNLNIHLDNPFKGGNTLEELLTNIVNDIVLPIGGILAVLAFIYSGFLYVTAQGNEAKIATAHKAFLYTVIGTALLLGALVLSQAIGATIKQLKS